MNRQFILQKAFLVGLLCGAVGCRSGREYSAVGTWHAQNPWESAIPQTIVLEKNGRGKLQYRGRVSTLLTWRMKKSYLQIKAYTTNWQSVRQPHADTLILVYAQHEYVYLKKQQRESSAQKTIADLLPLLDAPSVEKRLLNLVNFLQDGDFLDSETLCFLVGIRAESTWGESAEIAEQRYFIKQIRRIIKQGDLLLIETQNPPLETEIGYYAGKNPRTKQGSFDIKIAPSAHVQVIQQHNNPTKIKLNGIKIGKGILMFDAPDLEIQQNILKILGINLTISR